MNKKGKFTRIQILFLTILFLVIFGLVGGKYYFHIRDTKLHQITSKRASVDKPIAFYLNKTDISNLESMTREGSSLPNKLIIKPGIYKIYGHNYNLQREGLYRFLDPTKNNQQRIVYDKDVDSLLSSIAWISSHGLEDKSKTQKDLLEKAKIDKLSLNCGAVSLFAQRILDELGIENRIVTSLTLDEWNSYDTGHTLIEVMKGNYWQVYDLDNNVIFNQEGHYLNFLEFFEAIPKDNYTIEKIADDAEYDVNGSVKEEYDYSFYFEGILSNEMTLRNWYKRAIQIPLIGDGKNYYFFDAQNRLRIESYAKNYKYIIEDEFIKKYYNNNLRR